MDMIKKRNKSFFTKAKKGIKFKEEEYERQKKTYDFYCPKCRCKFDTNTYRHSVTVYSGLNAITKHWVCGTRCHRFVPSDHSIIEKLFLESNKTPSYYPQSKKMKDNYRKRGYERRTKNLKKKDEFEV